MGEPTKPVGDADEPDIYTQTQRRNPMTVDERFEQLERKTQRLEKRNKRLTVALTMTVVAAWSIRSQQRVNGWWI